MRRRPRSRRGLLPPVAVYDGPLNLAANLTIGEVAAFREYDGKAEKANAIADIVSRGLIGIERRVDVTNPKKLMLYRAVVDQFAGVFAPDIIRNIVDAAIELEFEERDRIARAKAALLRKHKAQGIVGR